VVNLPEAIGAAADYGLTVLKDASAGSYRFALFVLSPEAQGVLVRYGFAAPNLPQEITP
jgi:molybdate transport system substrate-binding protein